MIDLTQYDGSIVIGMFLDEPPPGSINDTCEACGADIIIGPKSQQVMAENPNVPFVKVCMPCGVGYAQRQDVMPEVHQAKDALRNP